MIEDWLERLEEGIRRQPVAERAALLERLLIAHESYEQFLAAAVAEAERRMEEVRAGRAKLIPFEVVLDELDRMAEEAAKNLVSSAGAGRHRRDREAGAPPDE